MSRRNSTKDTGMNATVVVAIRRSRAAHRASVSSKIPAIAGPAADEPRPEQEVGQEDRPRVRAGSAGQRHQRS